MAKAPAFQFYVRDWLSDPALQAASASTRGIWINCLCFMWEAPVRGELVASRPAMARLLGSTDAEFSLFLSESTDLNFADVTICNSKVTLRNRRMYREQQERDKTRKRVAKHRAEKAENDESNEDVTPPSSSSSSSSSSTAKKGKKKKEKYVLPEKLKDGFQRFWSAYPRKEAKIKAREKWGEIEPDEELLEKILDALSWQTKKESWISDRGKYIPLPTSWLNAERWEDEPPTIPRASPLSEKGQRTAANMQAWLEENES